MATMREAINALKKLSEMSSKELAALAPKVFSDKILDSPIGPQFENRFNSLPAEVVRDHFKILVDKKYLDGDQLAKFFISAFQEMKPPKKKFTFANIKAREKISRLFFDFYVLSGRPYGQKRKYAALLGEYFTGFNTNTIYKNFRN